MTTFPVRTVRLTPTPPDRPSRFVVVFGTEADGARSGRTLTPLPSTSAAVLPEQDVVGAGPDGLATRVILFHEGASSGGLEYVGRMRYGHLVEAAAQVTLEALEGSHPASTLWADADRLDNILDAWTWVLPARAEDAWTRLHSSLLRDFHARRPLTGRRAVLLQALERFLERNGGVQGSLLVELLTDLWAWHTVEHARTVHGPDPRTHGATQAVQKVEHHCGRYARTAAASVWEGYLATLRGDRVGCAAAFDRARRQDRTGRFLDNFTLRGLHTYASGSARTAGPALIDVTFETVQKPSGERGPAIIYAGDVKFFRRYFARLYFHGRLLRRTSLHFHVVGTRAEVDRAFEDARSLASAADRTAADGRTCRIGLSTEELPVGVADPVTYYACVRFMRFAELLGLYPGGLWIQDLDLVQTGPVEGFLDHLIAHDIGVVRSCAGFGCSPWKSVLGGNVWVADTPPARRFMEDVVRYMDAHWSRPSAWMLDQNALRCASDRATADCRVLDLAGLGMPLNQNSLAALIEA